MFDTMSDRLSQMPESTAELVDQHGYLQICMSDTMAEIRMRIRQTALRILFLMDYAVLPG